MRISKLRLLGIVMASVILGGCGQSKVEEVVENNASSYISEEITNETNELSSENTEEQIKEEMLLDETDGEVTAPELTVINNNAHFVQNGDKIYFQTTDEEHLGISALWAGYSDSDCGNYVLYEYDPASEQLKSVANYYSSGIISAQDSVIYSLGYMEYADNSDGEFLALKGYSTNGDTEEIILSSNNDEMLGTSKDGSYLATYHCDYSNNVSTKQISIYKSGELQNTIDVNDYCACVDLGSSELFYIGENGEDGYALKQLDVTTGETLILGEMPQFEDANWFGTVEQSVIDDDGIYFTYSWYEGTGGFFNEGYYVQATVGEAKSLSFSKMPERVVDGDRRIAWFAVDDGKMILAEGRPGTCEVNGSGILGYYDEMGNWKPVAEGWGNTHISEEGDYDGIEYAEKVGDYIFLVMNGNRRAPQDDIGWRYAYYRIYSSVYQVSIETGKATRLVHYLNAWND